MTRLRKINTALIGTVMLVIGVVMMLFPNDAYSYVLVLIGIGFLLNGLKALYYFFTMARFMVGGKMLLYQGVIMLDFAALTISFTDLRRGYILAYLAIIHAFTGVVGIMSSIEAKRYGARSFKLKLFSGILNIVMALSCLIFVRVANTAVYIYALGLIYSGVINIITAFRKTAFIYIR